jgi:hypothetical protein
MMKKTKWMAVTAGVASGLAMAVSAQAQGVTGGQYLDIDLTQLAANGSVSGAWAAGTWTDTPTGLEVAGAPGGGGTYSQLYYPLLASQIQPNIPTATEAVFTYTWNSGTVAAGVGVRFALDDSSGGVDYYNTGYIIPQPGVNTFTFPLQAPNQANIAAGATINGLNLTIDPGNVVGTYDITFNSITLEPVPEPATLALAGLGAAGMLALRRRK